MFQHFCCFRVIFSVPPLPLPLCTSYMQRHHLHNIQCTAKSHLNALDLMHALRCTDNFHSHHIICFISAHRVSRTRQLKTLTLADELCSLFSPFISLWPPSMYSMRLVAYWIPLLSVGLSGVQCGLPRLLTSFVRVIDNE